MSFHIKNFSKNFIKLKLKSFFKFLSFLIFFLKKLKKFKIQIFKILK